MVNLCSNYSIHGCPASFYLSCEAYLDGKNCWEVVKKPCCSVENLSKCSSCAVFIKAHSVIKKAV